MLSYLLLTAVLLIPVMTQDRNCTIELQTINIIEGTCMKLGNGAVTACTSKDGRVSDWYTTQCDDE